MDINSAAVKSEKNHMARLEQIDPHRSMQMETLLSIKDAARRLGGLSPHTINQWLSRGKLQRTKVGRRTMIRESQLLDVIKDGGKSEVVTPRRRTPGAEITQEAA
jgi:excisionase family DNA binding protein